RPFEQRRQNPPEERHDQNGQQRIDRRAEQVAPEPGAEPRHDARRARAAGRATRRTALRRRPDRHFCTRATRRLYQFMKAEKTRLMPRNTSITMMMISTSLPDWFITVPAKIWKISG